MSPGEKEEKLLILCVDRDGDLGMKTDVQTPTLGRKENLEAAVSLALADPEEADANAMFEAVRVYDQLRKEARPNENFQIATISGSQLLGVEADRKLVKELNQILEAFQANSVILVSDGYSDEAVLPLVESRVPVTSIRRLVVKHSRTIEETWAVLGRYLRILTENPRYARIALGIPGILLIILAVSARAGWLYDAWIFFVAVVGITLIIKGLGIDRATMRLLRWIREYEPPPLPVQIAGFAFAGGAIAAGVGIYLGISRAASSITTLPSNLQGWASLLPSLIGQFITQGIYLIVFGICVALSGRAIIYYFRRDIRLLRTLVVTVVTAWSSQIFMQVSGILINPAAGWTGSRELIFTIFIGVLLAIAMSLIALVINVKYGSFFKRRKKKGEDILHG